MFMILISALALADTCPAYDPVDLDEAYQNGFREESIAYGIGLVDQLATLEFEPMENETLPTAMLDLRDRQISDAGEDTAMACLFALVAQQDFVLGRLGRAYLADMETGELMGVTMMAVTQVSARNEQWIRDYVEENGWNFSGELSHFGQFAAFQLILRLEDNVDVAALAVEAMEIPNASLDQNMTYAYLSDIVAVGRNEPQLYGTQGACQHNGEWLVFPISGTIEEVDERRRAIGFDVGVDENQLANLCINFDALRQTRLD